MQRVEWLVQGWTVWQSQDFTHLLVPSLVTVLHEGLHRRKSLCKFKRKPEACATSQQFASLILILQVDKNGCFIANAMGLKERLFQGKKKRAETLDLFYVNTLEPSLKSPLQRPHDFASGPFQKKAGRARACKQLLQKGMTERKGSYF